MSNHGYNAVSIDPPVRAGYKDNFLHVWPELAASVGKNGTGTGTVMKTLYRGSPSPDSAEKKSAYVYEQLRGVIGCQHTTGQSVPTTEAEEAHTVKERNGWKCRIGK